MRGRRILCCMIVIVGVVTAGCGSAGKQLAAPAIESGSMDVLAASAVPEIPFSTKALTARALEKDSAVAGLAAKLSAWGYVDGRERVFQGQSRHLTLVISRSLVFKDHTGARSLVDFIHQHAGAIFGAGTTDRSLSSNGRDGWLITPAPCACHMAAPMQVALLDSGGEVVWLEINGPDATPDLVQALLDPSQSVAVS